MIHRAWERQSNVNYIRSDSSAMNFAYASSFVRFAAGGGTGAGTGAGAGAGARTEGVALKM